MLLELQPELLGLVLAHVDRQVDMTNTLKTCKQLLELKADHHLCAQWLCRQRPQQGMLLAIESNRPDIALRLLRMPCPAPALTAVDNFGDTALHLAAAAKQHDVVVELLRRPETSAVLNARNKKQETPLMLAAENGFVDIVNTLIQQQGINLDAQGKCGQHSWTALHRACRFGHSPVVRALCAAGCNVNAPALNNSWRPLMSACYGGHLECVAALLEHPDINVRAVDAKGRTAFDVHPIKNEGNVRSMLRAYEYAH